MVEQAQHDRALEEPGTSSAAPVRLGAGGTTRLVAGVLAPMLAQGIIVRRPAVVRLLDRWQGDDRAVRALQRARARYGRGPLVLHIPGRSIALLTGAQDAARVLAGSPEPFAPATTEKRAALQHFQPGGVLISDGAPRAARRRWNEDVLQLDVPLHEQAAAIGAVAAEELAPLRRAGSWDWPTFTEAWARITRRVTLGDGARDDVGLTDELARLRGRANWAYLRRTDHDRRRRLLAAVQGHLDRAEPGSLAATVAATAGEEHGPDLDLPSQVAHWLFAWDAAGIATHRAVALLAGHPEHAAAVRAELAAAVPGRPDLPLLRATVLESVRLWPTTLAVLRETTRPTDWGGRTAPAGTTFVLVSSLLHRDDEQLPEADRFVPRMWLDETAPAGTSASLRSMVPFSAGPARCPGRDLVLHTSSVVLAALLGPDEPVQTAGRSVPDTGPLPRTLDHTALRFALRPPS